MRIPFQVESGKNVLMGMIHIPHKVESKNKIALMCYGFNGERTEEHRMSVKLSEQMEESGIIMVRVDFRAQGISSGDMSESSLSTRCEDIWNVLNFLEGCFGASDPNRAYYLIGFSDGARVATGVLTREEAKDFVEAIILWNPVFSFEDNEMSDENDQNAQNNPENVFIKNICTQKRNFQMYGLPINLKYLSQLKKGNSYEEYMNLSFKKFCIWGSEDTKTKTLRKKIAENSDIKNYVVSGAEHLFNNSKQEQLVIEKTIDFIING